MPTGEHVTIVVSSVTVVGAAFGIVHSAIALRNERRASRKETEDQPWLYRPTSEEIRRIVAEHMAYESRRRQSGSSSSPIGGGASRRSRSTIFHDLETESLLAKLLPALPASFKRLVVFAAVAGIALIVLAIALFW